MSLARKLSSWNLGVGSVSVADGTGNQACGATVTFVEGPFAPQKGPTKYGISAPCPKCHRRGTLLLVRRTIRCTHCKLKAVFA